MHTFEIQTAGSLRENVELQLILITVVYSRETYEDDVRIFSK